MSDEKRSSSLILSLVIPVYNEESTLGKLFAALDCHTGIALEVIFSDGGSVDATESLINDYKVTSKHTVVYVSGVLGRARQMNLAADTSSGDYLLFLHADSWWDQPDLLSVVVERLHGLRQVRRQDGLAQDLAAHFLLNFTTVKDADNSLFYDYLSEKASLNRPGTIYGDQGMLLSRSLWQASGGFCADMACLEDVHFVDNIQKIADWELLPHAITTSARRYAAEGIVNSVLCNGLLLIIARTPLQQDNLIDYGLHHRGKRSVARMLSWLSEALPCLSWQQYFSFWSQCARNIAQNMWLPFYVASWLIPGLRREQRYSVVAWYDKWLKPYVELSVVVTFFAVCSWVLFYLVVLCAGCFCRSELSFKTNK